MLYDNNFVANVEKDVVGKSSSTQQVYSLQARLNEDDISTPSTLEHNNTTADYCLHEYDKIITDNGHIESKETKAVQGTVYKTCIRSFNLNGVENELYRQASSNNSDKWEPVAEILYDEIYITGEEAYARYESVEINLPTVKKSGWNKKRQALERIIM